MSNIETKGNTPGEDGFSFDVRYPLPISEAQISEIGKKIMDSMRQDAAQNLATPDDDGGTTFVQGGFTKSSFE